MYDIVIIQESASLYSWALRQINPYKVLASSKLVAERYLIENEVQELSNESGIFVCEEEN